MAPRQTALLLLAVVVCVAASGCGQQEATDYPTPTISPTATVPPPLPVDTPNPTLAGTGGTPEAISARHHPVFHVTMTLSGAAAGSATFDDDITGVTAHSCADTAKGDGTNWTMPAQRHGTTTIGGHSIGQGVVLTAADRFHGAALYTKPAQATLWVDSDQFNDGADTSIVIGPDGSGTLTLGTYTNSSAATLGGSVSWTCSLA